MMKRNVSIAGPASPSAQKKFFPLTKTGNYRLKRKNASFADGASSVALMQHCL